MQTFYGGTITTADESVPSSVYETRCDKDWCIQSLDPKFIKANQNKFLVHELSTPLSFDFIGILIFILLWRFITKQANFALKNLSCEDQLARIKLQQNSALKLKKISTPKI